METVEGKRGVSMEKSEVGMKNEVDNPTIALAYRHPGVTTPGSSG